MSHDDWREESNQCWLVSVAVRWLYREGVLAIFPTAGANFSCPQGFLEPPCCWWLCPPGVEELLRFFKKHIPSLCPESPTCSERLLARTVHAGMNYGVTQGHKCILLWDFYLYPFSSTWELMESIQQFFEQLLSWRWVPGDLEIALSQVRMLF